MLSKSGEIGVGIVNVEVADCVPLALPYTQQALRCIVYVVEKVQVACEYVDDVGGVCRLILKALVHV